MRNHSRSRPKGAKINSHLTIQGTVCYDIPDGGDILNIDDWRSQLKRGTLEFCILLMIQKGECYGYEMISRLEKSPILAAKESTIYPLLRRLLKEGLLASYWRDSAEGLPPRKYYALTDKGRDCLSAMRSEWDSLLSAIEEIKGES